MNPDNIDIVLVHTTHSGNIGGVARAMKNMGLHRMTLVSPLEFPAPEATWRAASAADVLGTARIVDTLEEAIADCQFVVGTSARERRTGACSTRSSSAVTYIVIFPRTRHTRA